MEKSKNKILKIIAIIITVAVIAVLIYSAYQVSLTKIPSKFDTVRAHGGGLNPMASYDMDAVIKGYNDFSLADAEHLVKVKFISKENRAFFVGDDGNKLFISKEENVDEYGKQKDLYVEDVVLTLEVQNAYWGGFEKGQIIKVVYLSDIMPLSDSLEEVKEVIIAISRATREREETIYEPTHSYEGFFYLDKKRVYPAFDMTYDEVYGLKGYGNPVGKYMGMKEKDFEAQMKALKK